MEITRLLKLMNSCTWTTTTTAGETLSEDNVTLSEPGTIFHKLRLDDWLPMLELAANQNGWSEDEKLKLLAGRLHGKAVCECTVLYLSEENVPSLQLYEYFNPSWTQGAVHWQFKNSGMHYSIRKKVHIKIRMIIPNCLWS